MMNLLSIRFALVLGITTIFTAQILGGDGVDETNPAVDVPSQSFESVRDFETLREFAKQASTTAYQSPPALPSPLRQWNYDDYIKVAYRPERATWYNQGLPYWIETFHRGFVQVDQVELFTLIPVEGSRPVSQRIRFSKDDFDYQDTVDADQIPAAGHAGLRLIGRFPGDENAQEILSFIGSSYFRARSGDTLYGSSARGLAIDIAMPQEEEFPDFRAFWVIMPKPDDEAVSVLAFLDGPRVTGAYRFRLHPGDDVTSVDVQADVYFREGCDKVAIAPLTSMWMWGDGLAGPPKDARPSVHDSDGLLVRTDDQQWTWRAFARQSYPSVTSIAVETLHGFGMIQRNRAFYHYDDHNARYDKRPSVWVTPQQPWTDGRIELLELPGAHEGVDNLAAYWLPTVKPDFGAPLQLAYRLDFMAGDPAEHDVMARATNLAVDRTKTSIELEVRFAGPTVRVMSADAPPRIQTSALRGRVSESELTRTDTGDWIVRMQVDPAGKDPVELQCQLYRDTAPVSESFRYLLPPTEPEFVYPAVYTRQE